MEGFPNDGVPMGVKLEKHIFYSIYEKRKYSNYSVSTRGGGFIALNENLPSKKCFVKCPVSPHM